MGYYRKKYRSNKEVLRFRLGDFARTQLKMTDFNPKSAEPLPLKGNEQKLIEFVFNSLNICLTAEALQHNSSPKKLVKYCAFTKRVLKLKYERDKVKKLFAADSKLYSRSIEEYELLYNYISHIPSDYYRFKYPSPEVKACPSTESAAKAS